MYRLAQRKGRCVQVSYDNGKTWKSTGCHTRSEAKRKLGLGTLVSFGEYSKDFFMRTDEDSFRFRAESRGKRISNYMMRSKQYRLDNCIVPTFGKMIISDITASDIESWFMRLKTPDGKPYANQTKNDILTAFRQVLGNAMVDGVVNTNEASKIKVYAKKTKEMGSLSRSELEKLFPSDDAGLIMNFNGNVFMSAFFCIFKDTGFRPCEIIALKRTDIREDLTVYTEWMYDFHENALAHRIKTSGHGKDYKVGKISEQTKRIIDMTGDSEYIFIDNFGKFDKFNTNKYFKNAVSKVLQRDDLTQYCLRHAFMTNIISKYPRELIMELMGHTKWEACYDDRSPDQIVDNLRMALSKYQAQ